MLWIMDQNRLGQYPRPFPKGIHPDRSQCWLESSPHKGLPVRMQLLHTIVDDAYFPNFITKTMRRTLSLLFGCWWQAVQRQVVWKLLWCWYWLWALLWTSTWMLSTDAGACSVLRRLLRRRLDCRWSVMAGFLFWWYTARLSSHLLYWLLKFMKMLLGGWDNYWSRRIYCWISPPNEINKSGGLSYRL